ncbi:hypothetical protein PTSG_06680 [Salpingoeca rosetta]|uniref:HEAT repeat-containing protein 6 n=1 Tax=Salpingoeca rosetta (strain ATCC 50818 / BSB-021) TaxID=946362 RepID=F2UFP5_SALR5|nr:uncharacterized protein PTSG_06680 [Salpingoeca rosetta]EGD75613.1 hypothetical protein PTSG_06680 [Salpingoeca rosetta]|eukprot:XP_004992070.1 hypothetical protein PTSG_06680 [Salpingoeca rosetta]
MKTFAAIVSSTLAEVQLSPLLRVPEAEAPGDKSSVGTDSAHARGSEKQQQSDADDAAHDIMALLLRYGSATQPLASPSASKPPAQSAQSAQSAPASVQVEALQALTALVCRHPRGLTHLWPRLSHLLLQLAGTTAAHAGDDGDDGDDGDGEVASVPKKQQVQPQQVVSSQDEGLNAVVVPRMLKLVEELGRFLQTAPQLQHSAVVFWEAFTESALQECIESDVPFVRSCACDCLASIGSSVFARLQAWKQRHYQVLLLGLSRDQAPPVKAAAGRALGSMVAYPHLQQDAIFMSDMVDALVGAAQDDNITVRVRASWALGNYCNALGALRSLGQLVLNRIVNAEQLHRLLDLSLALCEDKDKIRANALRAVGELARILPTDDRLFFEKCVTAIVNNTHRRPPKVQWNACHAARNVLRNRELKAITPEAVINLVDTLLGTIEHNSNYKVRIGAAGALRSLDRSDWTNQHAFAAALETLLATLTPTGQAKDFNEYRYRETLHKEVALTVHELLLSSPPETLKAASQVLHDQSSQLSIMFGILRREQQMQHGSRPASREAPSADNTSDGARSHDEHQHQHQQARGGDDDGPEQSEGGSGADIAIDVEALEAKLAGIVDVPVHGTRVAMAHEQQKQNGTAMEESETNDED